MVNYDYKSVSYTMYLYLTQMKRYKIHGKCIIDTDTRYLLKMHLDTRYKILFTYLRYVSRYLYLRYTPALSITALHFASASMIWVCGNATKLVL